jgi:hypothetical protein
VHEFRRSAIAFSAIVCFVRIGWIALSRCAMNSCSALLNG